MTHTGSCLCGGVRYVVHGSLRSVTNCHCDRCRKTTGHFMAATAAAVADVEMVSSDTLRWYDASAEVQYGFCHTCGSTLFWRSADKAESLSIAAGTLDPPTGLTTTEALFVETASDYHRLDDGLIQHPGDRP